MSIPVLVSGGMEMLTHQQYYRKEAYTKPFPSILMHDLLFRGVNMKKTNKSQEMYKKEIFMYLLIINSMIQKIHNH
jgi:hypothetical protein